MSWNIADYYLLRKLRRLESQLDFLITRVGSISSTIVVGGAGGVLSGDVDPNVAGIVPAPPTQPAIYLQYTAGVPDVTWWWHVGDQVWY